MPADVGSIVHPWYRGVHEWEVTKVAKLDKPVEYTDSEQGKVKYDPKIMLLASKTVGEVLWFPYWIITKDTNSKFRFGGGSAMLEEDVLLKLMASAIKQNMFSEEFLKKLGETIQAKLA
jgi:hypothetical protein